MSRLSCYLYGEIVSRDNGMHCYIATGWVHRVPSRWLRCGKNNAITTFAKQEAVKNFHVGISTISTTFVILTLPVATPHRNSVSDVCHAHDYLTSHMN